MPEDNEQREINASLTKLEDSFATRPQREADERWRKQASEAARLANNKAFGESQRRPLASRRGLRDARTSDHRLHRQLGNDY